jgi:hypothetical protein
MGYESLAFAQPRTVLEWQTKRFRDYWRDLSWSTPTVDLRARLIRFEQDSASNN